MRSELVIKTRSLAGSSDLTLLAPIKAGLVPSLESVTYKTRIKRVLKTLNMGRSSTHEYSFIRPFSDSVERVGRINSVRVAVIEPEDKVLLAVTFDGAWESYIRVLWQKVGALLDVIFCNTEDYVSGYDHSFEEWLEWVNRVQIETGFFYGMPNTVEDVRYLKNQESLHREKPAVLETDRESTEQFLRRQESIAWDVTAKGHLKVYAETTKLGLQGLAALYRLTDLYLPGSEDGKFLHRAARGLLLEFVHLVEDTSILEVPLRLVKDRFEKQLAWLQPDKGDSVPHGQEPPELPTAPPAYDKADVQGGILNSYDGITHGCLVLVAFDSPAAAAAFLERMISKVTRTDTEVNGLLCKVADRVIPKAVRGDAECSRICNLAFTYEGLRAAGLSETQLACFPQEFREGMEARASVLGDFRLNHPRRWRLPVRNWPDPAADQPERIELTAVHAIVQLRRGTKDEAQLKIDELTDKNHPLHDDVERLFPQGTGTRVLAVQPMRRYCGPTGEPTEHFGFVDGIGQPEIDPPTSFQYYRNQVHLGEILLGYDNEADHAPSAGGSCPFGKSERMAWLHNGSFLVVRKLRQDVEALEQAIGNLLRERPWLKREDVLAKMMGRKPDGTPLIEQRAGRNDFDYGSDAKGSLCPFQAHIRRANPRSIDPKSPPEDVPAQPGQRTARLMRRGMSYGPPYTSKPGGAAEARENAKERGIVFMAYNASITEQYEVVQRWLNGGNSTGVFSGQSDPFLGVAENARPRYFRFKHGGEVVRMAIDGWDALAQEPRPIVRLEWGAYLFTPSIKALLKLKEVAASAGAIRPVWSADDGLERLKALEALEGQEAVLAWKSVLEDLEAQEKFISASVWAAIREHRGGVVRTPYGVIVADRDLVSEVLQNKAGHYSVSGYHERMVQSVGEIYLGLDDTGPDGQYARQSAAPNAAIHAIKLDEAFQLARESTAVELGKFILKAQEEADTGDYRWQLTLDVKELVDQVLADICEVWFGLSEKGPTEKDPGRLKRGGSRWDWKPGSPPLYPGNFTAPSRYIFQPHPGESVKEFGCKYGTTLQAALRAWISDHRAANTGPTSPNGNPAPIGVAIFGPKDAPTPTDEAARTFVGILMGFLPPADGNLRLTLNEWLRDGTFWSLRASLAGRKFANAADAESLLLAPLKQAMQLRPSPELIWRKATRGHSLGGKQVEPEDTIVVSVVSATQQCLADGKADVMPVFGGDRSPGGPTHACPGYEAAMGVILGVLSALLEVKESMRPGAAPLSLVFEAASPNEMALAQEDANEVEFLRERVGRRTLEPESVLAPSGRIIRAPVVVRGASTGELLLWGDSWFHYFSLPTFQWSNIRVHLEDQGFGFDTAPMGSMGMKLEEMAAPRRRKEFTDTLRRLLAGKTPPKAVLLSGGGIDTVYDQLAKMLNPAPNAKPLNDAVMRPFVYTTLFGYYDAILKDIKDVCDAYQQQVPVLVHAYDYPVPDGRFVRGNAGNKDAWLYPSITLVQHYNLAEGTTIMRDLIDHLQAMHGLLAQKYANVRRVPGPGTGDPFAADYMKFWENELHPTPRGFSLIAQKFTDVLNTL